MEQALALKLRELPVPDGGRWLVGLSGGLDSTVLLHLLQRHLSTIPAPATLVAVHINHRMQPDADQWQAHCSLVCEDLGVEFLSRTVSVPRTASPEAAAREARYAEFEKEIRAGDTLFLAHHLDDQVETLLLRLFRGAGARGLSGMPPSRPLGAGLLCRPLLDQTRQQLLDYAQSAGLAWQEDPSNLDTQLDRNFLRNDILPQLAGRWPGYRATVARAATLLREQDSLLEALAGEIEINHNRFGDAGIPLHYLQTENSGSPAYRLRQFLVALGLRAPGQAALQEFLRQVNGPGSTDGVRLETGDWVLQVFDGAAWLLPSLPPAPEAWQVDLPPSGSLALDWLGSVSLSQEAKAVSAGRLTLALRRGGETMRTEQGTRSVKKLLQEARIPPWWRVRLPLLYRNDELLAIADIRSAAGLPGGPAGACWLCWQPPSAN